MRKENKIVKIKYNIAEKIQDFNCEALASIIAEHKLLYAVVEVINYIDSMDGVMRNEPHLEHVKRLLRKAIEENEYQHLQDGSEQKILDNVIPLFPEHVKDIA